MVDRLDIYTLTVVLCSILGVTALSLFIFYKQQRQLKGMREWAYGIILISSGIALLHTREFVDIFIAIWIANSLTILGNLYILIGMFRHLGLAAKNPITFVAICIAFIAIFALLITYRDPSCLVFRIHVLNLSHGILFATTAAVLLWDQRKNLSPIKYFTATMFLFCSTIHFLRSLYLLHAEALPTSYITATPSTSLYYLMLIVAFILLGFALLMLTSEQLHTELFQALSHERLLKKQQTDMWFMLSHEFKTPLSTIGVSAELIKSYNKTNANTLIQEEVDRVTRASKRLSKLLETYVTAQQFEEYSFAKDDEEINLIKLLENLCFEYRVPLKGPVTKTFTVYGNRHWLFVSLSSILDNALKYGETRSAVHVTYEIININQIDIHIFDDGSGITEDEQKHVFEKFYRSPRHYNESGGGLGLYMAKKIIDIHGGFIQIKNKPASQITVRFIK